MGKGVRLTPAKRELKQLEEFGLLQLSYLYGQDSVSPPDDAKKTGRT